MTYAASSESSARPSTSHLVLLRSFKSLKISQVTVRLRSDDERLPKGAQGAEALQGRRGPDSGSTESPKETDEVMRI